MDVGYRLKGNAVVICDGFLDPITLNLESVKEAIETIRANRPFYKTAEAYQLHLSKYKGALAFLEACLKST